jgi:hypothetical protein
LLVEATAVRGDVMARVSFGVGWKAVLGEIATLAGAVAEGNPETAADAAALAAKAIRERYTITPTSAGQVLRAIADKLEPRESPDDLCACLLPRSEHVADMHAFKPHKSRSVYR